MVEKRYYDNILDIAQARNLFVITMMSYTHACVSSLNTSLSRVHVWQSDSRN